MLQFLKIDKRYLIFTKNSQFYNFILIIMEKGLQLLIKLIFLIIGLLGRLEIESIKVCKIKYNFFYFIKTTFS